MKGPKQITISTGLPTAGTIVIGSEQESLHSVLAFLRPGSRLCDFMVDMTRMQFGEAGRGSSGEPYFLRTTDAFMNIMTNVCDEVEELGIGASHVGISEHTEVLNTCAERVWERWQNRRRKVGVIIVEWEVLYACWIAVPVKRPRSDIVARSIRRQLGNCTSLLVRRIRR
jgi:hypothetical protein